MGAVGRCPVQHVLVEAVDRRDGELVVKPATLTERTRRQTHGRVPVRRADTYVLYRIHKHRHADNDHALVMAALWNTAGHYIFALWFLFFFFFSSPNLSGRTLDVYHTSTHGVALVRI